MTGPSISEIDGKPLSIEQRQYLDGFFAGAKTRGVAFGDVEPLPLQHASPVQANEKPLAKEEKIKQADHPFDAFHRLMLNAESNRGPEPEDVFRFKWNGLFWLSPLHQAYMCRLRIPGGIITFHQAQALADISEELTTGYLQITTRNNLQLRLIEPENCPELLYRIESAGLHSRGAGADNVRNITANPTAGIDPYELIDVRPFVQKLAQSIISTCEFYDLPRKFNICFDGGGLIGAVEDTNDIGAKAVMVEENQDGFEPGIYFRIKLGGVTGHATFARDWGVLVEPGQLNRVIHSILRVFVAHGNRGNRKKARLKYLIEDWGLDKFRDECEKELGWELKRASSDASFQRQDELPEVPHSHIGVFPQKQDGLYYVGVGVPVGQLTPEQLRGAAALAGEFGSGELRFTVWQNFLIPGVKNADVEELECELRAIGLGVGQSNLRSGVVACTGNRYCKFSSTDTKRHAVDLMEFLEEKLNLDQAINIHITGCPHSCAQHYIGDIGLLGTKVKHGEESVEGYHVFVGGGFGDRQALGRKIAGPLPYEEVRRYLERALRIYLEGRESGESFQEFTGRHDLESLKALFTIPEQACR